MPCTPVTVKQKQGDLNGDGTLDSIGDPTDPMGEAATPLRFHAGNRRALGWVPAAQVVPLSGAVAGITLRSASLPPDGSAVMATITRPNNTWVVSLRTATTGTYDADLPMAAAGVSVVRGVLCTRR